MSVLDEIGQRDFVTLSYERHGDVEIQMILTFSDVYMEIWRVYNAGYAKTFKGFKDSEKDYQE